MFSLHPQLAQDTFLVGDFPLSTCRLMNDMQFPWLILVPRVPGITELYELSQADQEQFLRESSWLSSQLSRVFRADKMNVAGGWWKNLLNQNPASIGVMALGLYTAARVSEQIRAGILTVPRGQKFAASALGFTTAQSYRYVILPVAYRIVWPTITSESMNIFKNSAVLYALSVLNFFAYTKTMREETSQDIVILVLSTPVYLIITYTIKAFMAWIEKRMSVPGLGSGGK